MGTIDYRWEILNIITNQEIGKWGMQNFTRRFGLPMDQVNHLLSDLESKKLIRFCDSRRTLVELTEEGIKCQGNKEMFRKLFNNTCFY